MLRDKRVAKSTLRSLQLSCQKFLLFVLFPESAAAALKAAVQEAAASLEGPGSPAVAPTAYSPGVYNVNGDFFYDKTKSFYDKISCTSVDKLQHYAQPVTQQAPG